MIIIPFTEYPAISEDIDLDGTIYRFQFIWNTRGEYWTLTLSDTDNIQILTGIKLVLNYELIYMYKHIDNVPQGRLLVLDADDNNNSKIAYSDFNGERALNLLYMEVSDLE